MSDRFAGHASRLAGLATRLLGWPPHWFWRTTPREFASIFATHDDPSQGMSRAELDRLLKEDHNG
ncbi:phage tail assembly chaperone [Aurantiacibacter poecillastricola]|uniref:phage tail assembly chaperone n=1 Tax=Aurantiacibacter poecillastricola TaxID=3064385 RepID=UPI00273DCB0C|nr:phage tail assembly chaperone [Aurantiacibacter sp. 219JJ12-13]MDP5260314.1 phage tail assembly chaperone [Aurantiacibacter sp. 219JJ12-13]